MQQADRPLVALCAGKDCRKRAEFPKMRAALAAQCDVVELSCVGICKGPVVVARPAGAAPIVLSKLRSKRHRRELLRMLVDGRQPGPELADRTVRGSKRTTTVRRMRRTLAASS